LFVTGSDQLIYNFVSDILLLFAITFLFISLVGFLEERKASPFSLIMNIGIISALLFFLITFSGSIMSLLFENVNDKLTNPGLVSTIVTLVYLLIIIGLITYVFITLRHLFFLGQSKSQNIYFNTMLIFFLLASLSARYIQSSEFSFISETFLIVSILLIVINSIRISWIAFIVKKEKLALLVLSVVIAVLFIVNLSNSGGETIHSQLLAAYSPSLNKFSSIIMLYGAIYFSVLFFTTLFHIPTAEAFDRKAQEVSSLQYFSKLIT
jgi:hypothetical protein